MKIAALMIAIPITLLWVRLIGVRLLTENQLAELKSTKCPACQRNLVTWFVVGAYWQLFLKTCYRAAAWFLHWRETSSHFFAHQRKS